jgi:hypothetical protein
VRASRISSEIPADHDLLGALFLESSFSPMDFLSLFLSFDPTRENDIENTVLIGPIINPNPLSLGVFSSHLLQWLLLLLLLLGSLACVSNAYEMKTKRANKNAFRVMPARIRYMG